MAKKDVKRELLLRVSEGLGSINYKTREGKGDTGKLARGDAGV